MLYWICTNLSLLLLKIFFKIEIRGRELVPARGAFILACNHLSLLDPIVASSCCPRPVNFMARKSLFRNPFFGGLIWRLHAFPVEREAADIWSLREAMRRLKQGKALLMFPEGTRKSAGENAAPKAGVGYLACKLKVPVVPVFIRGTEEALPKGTKMIRFSKVSISFGPAFMVPVGTTHEDSAKIVMQAVKELSK